MSKNPAIVTDTEMLSEIMEYMKLVDVEEMLDMFVDGSLLARKTGNYSQDVTSLCNNGVAYVLARMSDQLGTMILDELSVVRGTYGGLDHTWIEVGQMIIDPTLAQFEADVPKLCIVDGSKDNWYEIDVTYTAKEWLIETMNTAGIDSTDLANAETADEHMAKMIDKSELGGEPKVKNPLTEHNSLDVLECVLGNLRKMEKHVEMEWFDTTSNKARLAVDDRLEKYDAVITYAENVLCMKAVECG